MNRNLGSPAHFDESWAQEAARGFAYASACGESLFGLLEWYSRDGRPLLQAPVVRDCVEQFLVSKREANRSVPTLHGYSSRLRRFAEAYGDWIPQVVTEDEIASFLSRECQPNTRLGWIHSLSTFFAWLARRRWVQGNPVGGIVRPRRCGGQGDIYRVGEAREILALARGTEQLGFWVLSLLAGMRTSEIQRLAGQPDGWRQVRLDDGVVEVLGGQGKTARRTFPIGPQLRRWLALVRRTGAPFCPPPMRRGEIGRLRRSVLSVSRGFDLGKAAYNMGRRSFISYRLALPRASYAGVAGFAGTSETMIRRYYRRAVQPAAAIEYTRLLP